MVGVSVVIDDGLDGPAVDEQQFAADDRPFVQVQYFYVFGELSVLCFEVHLFVDFGLAPANDEYALILGAFSQDAGVSPKDLALEKVDVILELILFAFDFDACVIEEEDVGQELVFVAVFADPAIAVFTTHTHHCYYTFCFGNQVVTLRLNSAQVFIVYQSKKTTLFVLYLSLPNSP